jgi:tRNA-splicing ligase RtcB
VTVHFHRISDTVWEIPRSGGMRVPGRVYATASMLPAISQDNAPDQVANVAWLPGIVGYSFAMPDIHWGYGFPIGGVAAFDLQDGVVSPGGVGYDINCGVRLLRSELTEQEVRPRLEPLIRAIFAHVPSGVGKGGPLRLGKRELQGVMTEGARWVVATGQGQPEDLAMIEEEGCLAGADPGLPSPRALQRGADQLGTLGSGNHFLEIGVVDEIYDEEAARTMGLDRGRVTLLIHSGSRGFGHQVCDDFIRIMMKTLKRYAIQVPDRQLCCAPLSSPEGQDYLAAMAAAVNFAFANRQLIAHRARAAFAEVLGESAGAGLRTVYEVAHNIAKIETHQVAGRPRKLCVHRKGATRAFGPGRPEVPARYRRLGQPVLIPGDMGRYSFVLLGTERAMQETFGSACHGAGRLMSRKEATRQAAGRQLVQEMQQRGVVVMAQGRGTIAEEMPEAYKDVAEVVDATQRAGLAKRVVRLRPLGVVKG